ncbi:MAG TPA: hypothetical protein PK950_01825 [Candidatus Paceibacterota bacterium]|nr:hypothetical protein [Candidatus Paceibacterota bacterium]
MNKLPDAAKIKISHAGHVFETVMMVGDTVGFSDGISFSADLSEQAIADGKVDVEMSAITENGIVIKKIPDSTSVEIALGSKADISTEKYGTIEIALQAVRVNAEEPNYDQWTTAQSA